MAAARLARRDFLRFGTVALGGLGLTALGNAAAARRPQARACILLYMDGGPSHIDLWDMKPEAPAEVRGPFGSIATRVPGIRVCEHLPRTARQMHRITQVRSVHHTATVHDPAVYQMLTGHKHPLSVGNLTVQPTDFPQLGTAFGKLDRRSAVMPKVIELPETMKMEARTLPGQGAGFLGTSAEPFRVAVTPAAEVVSPEFSLGAGLNSRRLAERAGLVQRLEALRADLEQDPKQGDFEQTRRQALDLLARPQIAHAFDLEREPAGLRERYGRNRHGQSVLLARRLVEAGARFVTVYWGKEPQDWADGKGLRLANNPWDTHRNQFPLLKEALLPRADRALAALIDDLHQRGLARDVLLVWMGDFGRTPKIDRKYASRDHWPHANTVLFAGAGCPGGAVIGRTDRQAAEVTDTPVTPADLAATIFQSLGIDPRSTLRDGQGRPFVLSDGTPLAAISS